MALDTLLATRASESGCALLRFYRWEGPAITVGRSVSASQARAAAICYPGASVYSRPTGGGIVYHGEQTSIALSWPRTSTRLLWDVAESYRVIHYAAMLGLQECGVELAQTDESDEPGGILCASSFTAGDLVSPEGFKVLGGAQWRGSSASLYQGHLWMGWVPAFEEAIALRIAGLLQAEPEAEDLSVDELEAAAADAPRWLLSAPIARAA